MSIINMVDAVTAIVEEAIQAAREEALGQGPAPDAEKTTFRIFDELRQAVSSDTALQEEVLAMMPSR